MIKTFLTLLILAGLVVGSRTFLAQEAVPCAAPILYSIGTFDRRFGLSQKDFLSALAEAEAVWEAPLGLDLFAHSPEQGDLKVNLVYDYRQEVTAELVEIESEVDETEAAYRLLERQYDALKARHSSLQQSYEARVRAFNERSAFYEQWVAEWNEGRRNSEGEFQAMEVERLALQAEFAQIQSLENELNSLVGEINSLVGRINRMADNLNLSVAEYNTIGASRGETFAGGIYTSDRGGERIDIYEFKSREKLVRILAHELGHALGLEHIDDEESIMYKLNIGEADKATAADLEALETLCNAN